MILEALEALESNPALYRLVVGLIVAIIINICGFVANLARTKGTSYDPRKLAETLAVYEGLILLLPEALPMKYAIVGAIIFDVVLRVKKALEKTALPLAELA